MTSRVMIIEDDQWLGESYARIIQAAGYEAEVVADADQAIEAIDEYQSTVILLDMLLTRTTGMALLHELQSHVDLAAIPVVMISSMAEQLDASTLAPYGIRHVLNKETVTPEEIVKTIREVTA